MIGLMSDGMRERLERLKRSSKPDVERLRSDVAAVTRHDPEKAPEFRPLPNRHRRLSKQGWNPCLDNLLMLPLKLQVRLRP